MAMLERKIPDIFIGRTREIEIFTHWLSDTNAPWILYLHDLLEEQEKKGGVGKTWLLRKFNMIAQQQQKNIAIVMVDFFNVEARDGVVIAERIVRAIQKIHAEWSPDSFDTLLGEYQNTVNAGNRDVSDIREQLSLALIADLERLHEQLQQAGTCLLVLFDTFELIEQNPVNAVLSLAQTFPDNYHFPRMKAVVAGRNALDWSHPNWREREQEVLTAAIAPFSQEELVYYINTQSITNLDVSSRQAQALYERTEGRPILVGLVTDVINHHLVTIDQLITVPKADFEASIVSQVNNLEKPTNLTILFMAHAYHRFNPPLLKSILKYSSFAQLSEEIQDQEWWEALPELSFVRRAESENDFVLHDEMRRLLILHWWNVQDIDHRYRKDISLGVISYYEQKVDQEKNEQVSQVYLVEQLYHKLFLNLEDGLKFFDHYFTRAINLWLTPFGRALLQEAEKFTENMSQVHLYNLKLAEAKLLRKEEKPRDALAVYQSLEREADPVWLAANHVDLLQEKGNCYEQMSAFDEAIACFEQCLHTDVIRQNEVRRARILRSLGYIQRRRGQLDTAARLYEESIAIHKKLGNKHAYADVLTGIAYLYRLQGKMEEALRRCKIALYIRRDLFQQGRTSEISVGLSISTMGVIYFNTDDLVGAENAFQEAFEIFVRTGYKKGIASTCNRFGQVEMVRGNLNAAKEWFEKGYINSLGSDKETQINSLNKQGWVFVLQSELEESTFARNKKLKEAIPFLEQAIQLARDLYDYYQEAESSIDLADVLERLKRHEASQQILESAEEIARRYNYNLLLGIAEEFQGNLLSMAGDYQQALDHLVASCRYMALYNPIRFNRALRKLIDALLATPKDEIDFIITKLVTYWSQHGLAKTYPEFINACEEVRSLTVL